MRRCKQPRVAAPIVSLLFALAAPVLGAEPTDRGLKICVASDAAPAVRHAAELVLAAAQTHPLLSIFSGSHGTPSKLTDTWALLTAEPAMRAYDHLVLIGLSDDPLIRAAWQNEARAEEGGFYVFGFGHLTGDIGYIESDRNPFLHSRSIPTAPYETELVTITGSTPAGVALAVEAFLRHGLVNGTIAASGWKRSKPGLLDRDPLLPNFAAPDWLPAQVGQARKVALSQAGEDEYRGVLEDTGVEPREIWQAKYYLPAAWDGAGADRAFANFAAGLHRRACGNTVWCARFDSAAQAAPAAAKIADAAKLKKTPDGWVGSQPPYGPQKESAGPLALWQHGEWVVMCTLPNAAANALRSAIR